MKAFTVLSVAVLAIFLGGTSRILAAEGAQAIEGNVRILKVKGTATVSVEGKPDEAMKEGGFIQDKQVVKTGKDSQAWLLFSNGTTVTVQPNSVFSVEKFLQIPFDSKKVDYSKIKAEPSISQTKISDNEGSIIADVTKLRVGSTFKIGTPVGVAGIRGTLISVIVNTTAGGTTSVTIDMPHGLSDFAVVDGRQLTLSDGQTVTVVVNPANNTVTLGNVSPLSAQTSQAIQALAQQVAATVPTHAAYEGVPESAPEIIGAKVLPTDAAGGFGGDTGTGNVGTAPLGGGGGGGGGGGTPTPNPPPS